MRTLICCAAVAAFGCVASAGDQKSVAELEKEGFVRAFDGKTLSGWKTAETPESWAVTPEGYLKGSGNRSHIFSPKEYTDFEFRAEIMTQPHSNSGMYFRAAFEPGWPRGYEAQVCNTHPDPQKTGSLYNLSPVKKQLVKDGEWWTQHIICKGDHIVIKVNGETVVDFHDKKKKYTKGHLAFQQHDPGGVVLYRNVMIKDLATK